MGDERKGKGEWGCPWAFGGLFKESIVDSAIPAEHNVHCEQVAESCKANRARLASLQQGVLLLPAR